MLEHILQEPLWLRVWIFWMMGVNLVSVVFLRHREARWVLAAFLGAALLMESLYQVNGYNRFLGVAHIVFWAPLVFALWRGRRELPENSWFERWVWAVMVTNSVSLVVDVVDVVRYFSGDRA